jgi:hypothetical protein
MEVSVVRKGLVMALALVVSSTALPNGRSMELIVPGRSNAYPSIAGTGRFVVIAWGATTTDGATDIYTAVSRDAGRTFGVPVPVNDAGGRANLSGEQPPRVSIVPRQGKDPSIVVVWTSKTPAGTRLLSARSDDGGNSFGGWTLLPDSDAPGNRGWQATATDPSGRVLAVWLDHRELARPANGSTTAKPGQHQHGRAADAHQMDGAARAQRSKLYFSPLDGTKAAQALTGGVCYCCRTTIAAARDGAIYAAWRHVYPGNVRDIAFTMSRDGGRTFAPPVRISDDNWVLDGCPENGPAMTLDANGRIHVVWPTLVPGTAPASEPTLALFYTTSTDGRQFRTRQRIPTEGFARHPQITLDPGGAVVVTWDEQADGGRRVALGRGTPDASGSLRFARRVVSEGTPATYPVLTTVQDAVVTAWTSGPSGQSAIRLDRFPTDRK